MKHEPAQDWWSAAFDDAPGPEAPAPAEAVAEAALAQAVGVPAVPPSPARRLPVGAEVQSALTRRIIRSLRPRPGRAHPGPARRGFLTFSVALGAGLVGALARSQRARASEAESVPGPAGRRPSWGMAIDLDRCTTCGGCVTACRSENNVPPTSADPRLQGTEIAWMTLLHNDGEQAHAGLPQHFPTPCMHCADPPCIKVCPVGATYQDAEGIVQQVWDRCIGCRFCENACPYTRRYFNWGEPEWPETYLNLLNPDVATRPHGVVEKCTFCTHRIRDARETARREERALTDEDVRRLPACATACPTGAITFGDLADPDSTVSRLAQDPRATRLLEHLGTQPKVVYLRKSGRSDG